MYYVYILYSASVDKYYTGYSSDTESRVRKHKAKHKGFTGQSNDWKIVYSEAFLEKNTAIRHVRQTGMQFQ